MAGFKSSILSVVKNVTGNLLFQSVEQQIINLAIHTVHNTASKETLKKSLAPLKAALDQLFSE